MKRFFLCLSVVLILVHAKSALRTWDGEALNPFWTDPVNWSDDLVPGPADDVILDNAVVAGSYHVILPVGDVSVAILHLRISPMPGATIRLMLPPENNSLNAFRALGDGDALVLDEGAIFINESGAGSSSTPVAVSSAGLFRINNGGRYIHRTARSATENLISRLSTEAGTEYGIFEFDVPVASYIISLSGRSFGSLWLSASHNNAMVSYRGSGGSPLRVRGDLKLSDTVNCTLGLSAPVTIDGTLTVATPATLDIQSAAHSSILRVAGDLFVSGIITETGSGEPALLLNGASRQLLHCTGQLKNQLVFVADNADAIKLGGHLSIPYKLQLNRGRILSDQNSLLIFPQHAVCTAADGSFIEGPVLRLGDNAFVFPVGLGSISAPLRISNTSGSLPGDSTTVEYLRANPQTAVSNVYEQLPGRKIDHISNNEYWKMRHTGNASGEVTVKINPESFCKTLEGTFIAGFNGQHWGYHASVINAGPIPVNGVETGEIGTVTDLAGLTALAPGTALSFTDNPLPLRLVSFTATRASGGAVNFQWEIADPDNEVKGFFIGQQRNDQPSTDLAYVPGSADKLRYEWPCQIVFAGDCYYRLRMIDKDGNEHLSPVITIRDAKPRSGSMELYPNPVAVETMLIIESPDHDLFECEVYDFRGVLMQRITRRVLRGNNLIPLSLKHLQTGVYLLSGRTGKHKLNTIRFFVGE